MVSLQDLHLRKRKVKIHSGNCVVPRNINGHLRKTQNKPY